MLEAVAYIGGKECGRDILRSAIGKLHLQAEVSEQQLAANGQDGIKALTVNGVTIDGAYITNEILSGCAEATVQVLMG